MREIFIELDIIRSRRVEFLSGNRLSLTFYDNELLYSSLKENDFKLLLYGRDKDSYVLEKCVMIDDKKEVEKYLLHNFLYKDDYKSSGSTYKDSCAFYL